MMRWSAVLSASLPPQPANIVHSTTPAIKDSGVMLRRFEIIWLSAVFAIIVAIVSNRKGDGK
jgi:hypothetical protein